MNCNTKSGAGALRRPFAVQSRSGLVVLALAVIVGCGERSSAPANPRGGSTVAPESGTGGMTSAAVAVRTQWVADIDSLAQRLERLEAGAVALSGADKQTKHLEVVRALFRESRLAFKRAEFLTAYYEPTTAATMNGPALPRVEAQEGPEVVFPPEGFQVIEEMLFAQEAVVDAVSLAREVQNLRALTRRLRTTASVQVVTDDRVWDAARLELARVSTLGITGYDSPIALESLNETAAALRGVADALSVYEGASQAVATDTGAESASAIAPLMQRTIAMLEQSPSFATFDRLEFIVAHVNPLAHAVERARERLALVPPQDRRAFRLEARSLFDSAAIDAHAFANPLSEPDRPEQVALGRRLFFDTRLTADGTQSCATCHDPQRAFTDGRSRSVSRRGESAASMRNTPTVLNVGLQNGSFYDQRTAYLEDQVEAVVGNPNEMHSSVEATAARLSADTSYRLAFSRAFRLREAHADSAINGERLRVALAAYLRSLNGLNTRVDRALRGDSTALSAEERAGFNLFSGKAKCATCHFIPLFTGSVPPNFQSTDVEVIGVPSSPVWRGAKIDPDSGRFRVTHAAPHLYAFKTPGLRNVALTAPYMHNGVYRTLDEVVDFYNRGGGAGIGVALPNQTLPREPLQLTRPERAALVAMLRALTDTSSLGQTGTTARR